MRHLHTVIVIILLAGIVFCSGCANLAESVRLTDNLPKDAKKGYAEFYLSNESTMCMSIPLRQIDGDKVRYIAPVCLHAWSGTVHPRFRRRVACVPGAAAFIVRTGFDAGHKPGFFEDPAGQRVNLVVTEGMVTPVRITLSEVSRNYDLGRERVEFRADIVVEPASSLAEHEERMRQYEMNRRNRQRQPSAPRESEPAVRDPQQ